MVNSPDSQRICQICARLSRVHALLPRQRLDILADAILPTKFQFTRSVSRHEKRLKFIDMWKRGRNEKSPGS